MKRQWWTIAVCVVAMATVGTWLFGCGSGGSGTPPPVPMIQNINSSTTPTSPVGLPIEINGSGFQAAPGKVNFKQGSTSVDVVPAASAWSDTGMVAAVPTTLTAPGTVSVTVVTSGGTSNAVTLNLVGTITFNPSAMGWATTMALPKAMTGLRAVALPGISSTSAFAVVTGGYDGTANTNTVWANNLNQDGTVGSTTNTTWTAITTNPLPTTLAHHAMAEADDTNSLVAAGKRYIYVLGGQVNFTDAPGGTNTVYVASVDSTAGTVGTWTASTNTLPKSLFGLSATVHNGYLYVAGGLDTNGNPVSAVYTAPVNTDGTIGTWTTATNSLPTPRAFGTMVVFGGIIYYINGDPNASLLPNTQEVGDKDVDYATAVRGVVGTWTLNGNLTIHDRAKGVLFTAYGQMIAGEGVYTGSVGSGEMESSSVNAQNTTNVALNSWTGLTGTQAPSANVYNAAELTSPLFAPTTNGPRFLILGGQALTGTTGPGGALSSTVFYNTKP
jgi:IPT/TIG domain-containing protein